MKKAKKWHPFLVSWIEAEASFDTIVKNVMIKNFKVISYILNNVFAIAIGVNVELVLLLRQANILTFFFDIEIV
jgi:hypothetical protein